MDPTARSFPTVSKQRAAHAYAMDRLRSHGMQPSPDNAQALSEVIPEIEGTRWRFRNGMFGGLILQITDSQTPGEWRDAGPQDLTVFQ